jgi:hypothetical protein
MDYHLNDKDLKSDIVAKDLEEKKKYCLDIYHLNIFTKKGMEKYIFKYSRDSFHLRLHCDLIAYDKKKYQELVNEEKYQWIFEELLDIINPPFSRSKYEVKLT